MKPCWPDVTRAALGACAARFETLVPVRTMSLATSALLSAAGGGGGGGGGAGGGGAAAMLAGAGGATRGATISAGALSAFDATFESASLTDGDASVLATATGAGAA